MKKQNCAIIYFLTQSLFLGLGLSLLFLESGKDTYIGAILGTIIGFFITLAYRYIIKLKKTRSLQEIFSNSKIIGPITRIIFFILSIILLLYILVIYKLFVNSFLLINTPVIVIIIPFVLLACYSAFKGLTNIHRVANCLLPLALILTVFNILSLFPYFETDNFLPLLAISKSSIFKTSITFAGISTFPNILSLHLDNQIKNYSKMYLLSSISLIIIIALINGVLGEALIRIFRFPEYMVLKQLKLLNFIEKYENVLSITWIFSLFVSTSLAIYSLKETLPQKKNKLTTVVCLILLIYIIIKVFKDYTNELKIYYLLPYLSIISSVLIILPMLYLVKKAPQHQQYNKHPDK